MPYYDSRQSILLGILIALILAVLAVIKCCKTGIFKRNILKTLRKYIRVFLTQFSLLFKSCLRSVCRRISGCAEDKSTRPSSLEPDEPPDYTTVRVTHAYYKCLTSLLTQPTVIASPPDYAPHTALPFYFETQQNRLRPSDILGRWSSKTNVSPIQNWNLSFTKSGNQICEVFSLLVCNIFLNIHIHGR